MRPRAEQHPLVPIAPPLAFLRGATKYRRSSTVGALKPGRKLAYDVRDPVLEWADAARAGVRSQGCCDPRYDRVHNRPAWSAAAEPSSPSCGGVRRHATSGLPASHSRRCRMANVQAGHRYGFPRTTPINPALRQSQIVPAFPCELYAGRVVEFRRTGG